MAQVDLIATIDVPDATLSAVLELLAEYAVVVRAEPGNQRFEMYTDRDRPAVVIVERYRSEEAFQAHLDNPANATFNASLAGLLAGGGSTLQFLHALPR